jgi:hypothetical protein
VIKSQKSADSQIDALVTAVSNDHVINGHVINPSGHVIGPSDHVIGSDDAFGLQMPPGEYTAAFGAKPKIPRTPDIRPSGQ